MRVAIHIGDDLQPCVCAADADHHDEEEGQWPEKFSSLSLGT